MTDQIDRIYDLAEQMTEPCVDKDLYTVLCACIELLTETILEMEDAMDDDADLEQPGIVFARIFNNVMSAKREMITFEEEERDGATLH